MSKKDLEIMLQQTLRTHLNSKLYLEQYMTPIHLAAKLVHRAYMLGDVESKNVLDMCAGVGTLGIGSLLLGASHADFVEIDPDAVELLKSNLY